MRIDELLARGSTRSFEFFPPHSAEEAATLAATIEDLADLDPSFVSVTNRGGSAARERTFELVTAIERQGRLTTMAHLIARGQRRDDVADLLVRYRDAGVANVLVLGGDPPTEGPDVPGDFAHACDLADLVREVGGFAIGVAAHPAGHPASADRAADRDRLAAKLAGADFAITQFFFRADEWSSLVADLAERGVTRPVLPGLMPVTALSSIGRMATMGAPVPTELVARLEAADRAGGASAVRAAGIAAATDLAAELLARGAPGLHFYTLNRSSATREIHQALATSDRVAHVAESGPRRSPADLPRPARAQRRTSEMLDGLRDEG